MTFLAIKRKISATMLQIKTDFITFTDLKCTMTPIEILHLHHLTRSACREGILRIMLEAHQALSENEIKCSLQSEFDRTTFYRSFKVLIEKNIIHKIILDNNKIKYAISHGHFNAHSRAHFYCNHCKKVLCIPDFKMGQYQIPNGYDILDTEVILRGNCEQCKSNKS